MAPWKQLFDSVIWVFQSLNTMEGLLLSCKNHSGTHQSCDSDVEENGQKVGKKIEEEVECFEKLRLLYMAYLIPLQVVEYYISLCSKELKWLCLSEVQIKSTSIQKLGSFQKLRVLQIYECRELEQLPESIGKLCDLMELDLSRCGSLKSLPESIGKLKSLKILKIIGCISLEEIPAGVGKLSKLEYIYARECGTLKTLCEFGTEMQHLTELHLSGCKNLKTIKSLGKLRSLKRLDLKECGDLYIDNLCGDLDQLLQLQYLDLLGCSKLGEELVNTIQKKQLHTYKLEMLNLPIIPEVELPACRCLRTLRMKNGLLLTSFFMSSDNLSHLEHLYLTDDSVHPSVKMLPDSLWKMEQLKRFRLKDFKVLERLPENLGQLSLLQQLGLFSSHSLVELPRSLGQLSRLELMNLSHCRALKYLPESLGQLSQLQGLHLDDCTALTCLPESLGQLSQLAYL
jgi:Leucine-rich repeat (LRR) protein